MNTPATPDGETNPRCPKSLTFDDGDGPVRPHGVPIVVVVVPMMNILAALAPTNPAWSAWATCAV
jgi:hypothetical protein